MHVQDIWDDSFTARNIGNKEDLTSFLQISCWQKSVVFLEVKYLRSLMQITRSKKRLGKFSRNIKMVFAEQSFIFKKILFILKIVLLSFFVGNIISSIQLKSPVTFTYAHHYGPVYSAEFSPFHRNAFLTSSMDQTLRLYSMLQVSLYLIPFAMHNWLHSPNPPNILEMTFRFIDQMDYLVKKLLF